jgi:antitoxin component of MazEF toxin-antitoxin module
MFIERVRKSNDGFVISIPAEEAERLGLHEGQEVSISLATPEQMHALRPELQEAFDRLWPEMEPAIRYLEDR